MSGLVATAPTTATNALSSGEWFPVIDPADARAVLRIDGTVTDPRLIESLTNAMASIEDRLTEWQVQQVAAGYASMADVPAKVLGGTSRLVLLYRRAVYFYAQAEIIERYREQSATNAADRRAEAFETTVDDCHRYVRYAVRDILGIGRATVALI